MLNLSYTEITDLSGIEELTGLQVLNLRRTNITNLSGIEKLTDLQELDLSGTKIDSNELKKLLNLKELRRIDLRNLRLAEIPEELLGLNLPFYTTFSERLSSDVSGIFLRGTELINQSLSLFDQDRSLIEEYYNKQTKSSTSEAKVIFLGYGRVGKTHTIERIKKNGEKIEPIEGDTPGISITSVADFDNSKLNVQFWDFGGQDIMHSMHRCFLIERCCYVIVVNSRHGDVNKQARYWLNNVKSYAPSAPVILFENRWGDGHNGGGLDAPRLKNEFPNIKQDYSFSALKADEASFNSQLVAGIHSIFNENSSITLVLPVEWAKVHDKLLKLNDSDRPFIEKDEYYKICQDCGETADTTPGKLLSWFNDLGICFSYHMDKNTNIELGSYQLFAPNWIINAMYTIINNSTNLNENGIIFRESINNMLTAGSEALKESLAPEARYEGKTDYILEIMRKHKLSFEISETQEFIPALCVNKTPKDLHPTEWKKHTTYKYVYNFLPDNVVHRMMICYREKNMLPAKLWLKGFRIDDHAYDIVLVIDMAKEDNILLIDIYSLGDFKPYKQFKLLKGIVSDINSNLGLTPYESITVEKDGVKQDISMETLIKMVKAGRTTCSITDERDFADITLRDVLDSVIDPREFHEEEMPRPESSRSEPKPACGSSGGGGNTIINVEKMYNPSISTASVDNSKTTVTYGCTVDDLMKLLDKLKENSSQITEEMIDTIANQVNEKAAQTDSATATALKEIATVMKETAGTPETKIEKCIRKGMEWAKIITPIASLIYQIVYNAVTIGSVA